eukprot:comp13534_c0_seq1/m.9099 comp13534_c0_seq1/g.9099  ORF comp13534_c0_seq1/g.9099 comp13534_c0_seq1/m.9099 type:complete len:193 (-) comp13534_c0_seq1:597-1175(-)
MAPALDQTPEVSGTIGQVLSRVDPKLMTQAKQTLDKGLSSLKPWSEFCDSKAFSKPAGVQQALIRITRNGRYFAPNYTLIFIGLLVYCLITSPMLLFAVAFVCCGAAGIIHMKDKPPINIGGRSLGTNEQGILLACISLPLFFFASAGTVVFWLLGFSACIVVGHASMIDCEFRTPAAASSDPWTQSVNEVA